MAPVTIRTGGPLNRMRANATKMLPDTCTLSYTTGSPRVLTVMASNVPCRVAVYQPGINAAASEYNQSIYGFTLTVPWNQTIGIDWQVLHNGHTYEIWELLDDQTPLVYKSAHIRRVTA